MRRASLAGALIALMLLVAPVVAHHKDGHSGGPPSGVQKDKDEDNDDGGSQGRFSADSAEDCEDARNHGQYVSCIVHLVHGEGGGGDVEAEDIGLDDDCDDYPNLIACAANSDVGKDENDEESRAADQDNDDNEDNEDNED